MQSRYYNPETGRFINADSFASTGQGVLGYNMFAYCGNNPVNFIDPSGQIKVGILEKEIFYVPVTTPQIARTPEKQIRGVLNGQATLPYSDRGIGLGSYGKSGCPYIATYNAMQLIGQPQTLASVTSEVFNRGNVLFGAAGAGPWGTAAYFKAHGVDYIGSFSANKLTDNIAEGSVIVFTAMYSSGWHAMTALYTNEEYWVFNRYNGDRKHRIYTSLNDVYSNGWWIYGFRIDP